MDVIHIRNQFLLLTQESIAALGDRDLLILRGAARMAADLLDREHMERKTAAYRKILGRHEEETE